MLASKLYSVIKSRIHARTTFLPTSSTIEKYALDFGTDADLRSYGKHMFNTKFSSNPSKKVVLNTDLDAISNMTEGTILYFDPVKDPSITSISITDKQMLRDILVAFREYFTFNIKSWLNVHLLANIDQSYKNHELVKLYAQCFDHRTKNISLFNNTFADGNIKLFCSYYNVSASLTQSTYTLVTLKPIQYDYSTFCQKFPVIKQYYHTLNSASSSFTVIIRSDNVDFLMHPPDEFNNDVHTTLYDSVIHIPIIEDSRRFTLVTNQKIPFDIVKCSPYLDDFRLSKQTIAMNFRGVRTIGLVANKASGKSSLMKMIPKCYVIIDSDLYGQLFNHLRVILNNTESGFSILSSKNYEKIYELLDSSLTIEDNQVTLNMPDTPSFIELRATQYLQEQNLTTMNILFESSLQKHITMFRRSLNKIYDLFPLETYYHVICDWSLRKFSSSPHYTPSSKCIVFGHYSYELYSLLGGALFHLAFPGDLKLNILLRSRDTPITTDLFLQKVYEQLETRSYNSEPAGLMVEVLRVSGHIGTNHP